MSRPSIALASLLLLALPTPAQDVAPLHIGESVDLHSKVMSETRPLRVYLPASYGRGEFAYPVFYVLDGEVNLLPTAGVMQQLATAVSTPQLPEAIVVAVHNTSRERDLRTPTMDGDHGGERFLSFLEKELIPFVDERYRTQPLRVLIGHSQGGSFATYALATRPDAFRFYLTIDPPLHLTPGLKEAAIEILSDPENALRLVSCERGLGWFGDWKALEKALAPHAHAERIDITDATHETMVVPSLFAGLRSLFHDYVLDGHDLFLEDIDGHYQNLTRAFGFTVQPPKFTLSFAANLQVLHGRGRAALALYDRHDELYGRPDRTSGDDGFASDWEFRGRAGELKAAGPDRDWTELYAQLELPPPDPETMARYLGDWAGRVDVPSGSSYGLEISFRVEDGIVRSDSTATFPGGDTMKGDDEGFLRVLDDGALRWGSLGRGVGMNTVTVRLVDGELVGKAETVGIVPLPRMAATVVPNSVRLRRK